MLSALRIILHTLSHALVRRVRRLVRAVSREQRPLRVGIDIRPLYEPLTGIGWYLYHLLHELAKRDDVELLLFGDARVTDLGPHLHAAIPSNATFCTFDLRGRGKISRAERAMTAGAYVLWIALEDCDVMFGANYFLPRLLSATARSRVVTVHDLTYKRFPELLQKETLHNLEAHMKREIAQSNAVICVSESTRHDLLHFYQADERRIVAIHSGIAIQNHPTTRAPENLPARYILFVSTVEPRKNLDVLLRAFDEIDYDGSLVIVGKIGWKSETIVPRLRAKNIVHLDYLAAEELAAVYARAELFVFPSIYEGFGFPILEAMAHDVPVIAANTSSLPEIGGDAALYFDPRDAQALAREITRVTTDRSLRETLVARGRVRVQQFRWERTAEETLGVLRRASHD